jgi:hypothetical protein
MQRLLRQEEMEVEQELIARRAAAQHEQEEEALHAVRRQRLLGKDFPAMIASGVVNTAHGDPDEEYKTWS